LVCPCMRGTEDEGSATTSYFKNVSVHSEASSQGGSAATRGFQAPSYSSGVEQRPTGAIIFTMAELSKGTANFSVSNKIGQGGFGMVYRGKLRDGRIVAIKRAKKVYLFVYQPRVNKILRFLSLGKKIQERFQQWTEYETGRSWEIVNATPSNCLWTETDSLEPVGHTSQRRR
jgi:serine/threonine protein kinase